MTRFPRVIALASIALMSASITAAPVLADMNQPFSYHYTANKERFAERIGHIQEQIDKGAEKGWLSPDEVTKFRGDHDRLAGMEQEWQHKGCPESEVDSLEHEVTSTHHYLHQAIAHGSHLHQ